jgi:hypothetical protein
MQKLQSNKFQTHLLLEEHGCSHKQLEPLCPLAHGFSSMQLKLHLLKEHDLFEK